MLKDNSGGRQGNRKRARSCRDQSSRRQDPFPSFFSFSVTQTAGRTSQQPAPPPERILVCLLSLTPQKERTGLACFSRALSPGWSACVRAAAPFWGVKVRRTNDSLSPRIPFASLVVCLPACLPACLPLLLRFPFLLKASFPSLVPPHQCSSEQASLHHSSSSRLGSRQL